MKIYAYFFFLLIINNCSSFAAKKPTHYTPNFFSPKKDFIDFSFISPTPFTFQVSSCFHSSLCAQNLFDSNIHSIWKSESTDKSEWILIDFGDKRLMNQVQLDIPKNANVYSYKVQVLKREKWHTLFESRSVYGENRNSIGNIDATLIRIYIKKKQKGSVFINNLKVRLNDANLTGIENNLTGYRFPIPNALFPDIDYSLPGAPRAYRNGIHKGIDIIHKKNSSDGRTKLTKKDPVIAINDGIIVRADLNYIPMNMETYKDAIDYTKNHRVTYVDKDFGGRQIWIDHQNGIMSSYNHLSSIHDGIKIGSKVKKGQIIGQVGNSGLRAEAENSNESIHLHLEIWVNGEFLGKGLDANQSKKLLQYFFTE